MEYGIIDPSYSYAMSEKFIESENVKQIYLEFNGMGGRLEKDGNQWCAITGIMPENHIAGFADTAAMAVRDWYNNFWNEKIPTTKSNDAGNNKKFITVFENPSPTT